MGNVETCEHLESSENNIQAFRTIETRPAAGYPQIRRACIAYCGFGCF